TEGLLNAKHFSRLPPKSVARQEALWQDTLREGSVRALCQGREYNSSGLTCHSKEAVRARNSIGRIGTPICGENTNALTRFALLAQGEQVHIANYPRAWPFTALVLTPTTTI